MTNATMTIRVSNPVCLSIVKKKSKRFLTCNFIRFFLNLTFKRCSMNFETLASLLAQNEHKTLFLRFNPYVPDFTFRESECELQIYFPDKQVVQIALKNDTIPLIISMLKISLFIKDNKVVVWDWKSFASFILGKTGQQLKIDASIIDLMVIESFNGIVKNVPESYVEALNRLRNLISNGYWAETENIYKQIYLPLMTEVLPAMETIGIIDLDAGSKVHAHYQINGQENGRLRCYGAYKTNFNPHTIGPEAKKLLKPIDHDSLFMSFDFKGMEVFVLAHLSKDERLQALCQTDDIYLSLAKMLFGSESDKNNRELTKKCFLPVIYGQSSRSLSQRCGIAVDVAERVVEQISSLFPASLSFVADYEQQVKKDGFAKDVFGKRRTSFESGKEYLARNFAVQSPAATICLEKLIKLHYCLLNLNQFLKHKAQIAYTVHDGYVVYITKENWKQVLKKSVEVLTSESEISPGLKLKVSCKGGRNLDDLKYIKK